MTIIKLPIPEAPCEHNILGVDPGAPIRAVLFVSAGHCRPCSAFLIRSQVSDDDKTQPRLSDFSEAFELIREYCSSFSIVCEKLNSAPIPRINTKDEVSEGKDEANRGIKSTATQYYDYGVLVATLRLRHHINPILWVRPQQWQKMLQPLPKLYLDKKKALAAIANQYVKLAAVNADAFLIAAQYARYQPLLKDFRAVGSE